MSRHAYRMRYGFGRPRTRGGVNGGAGTPSSWRSSSDTPDDLSASPAPSCAGGASDSELSFTIGVTEATPYACQFCDKAFPRLSYLKRHEQVHSDRMPFRCDFCQRLFKHKRSRDRHVKLHTGDRKYRCSQCEAAFSRSDHLKIHMKTHDHAKPFQCALCNRGYNTAAALTSHMQNHRKTASADGRISGHSSLQGFSTGVAVDTSMPPSREDSSSSSTDKLSPGLASPARNGTESQRNGCRKDSDRSGSASPPSRSKDTDPQLPCGFCSRRDFPSLEALQSHVRSTHVPFSAASLVANSGSHHHEHGQLSSSSRQSPPAATTAASIVDASYECEYCGMKLPSVHALQTHTLAAHSFTEVLSKRVSAMAGVDTRTGPLICSQCGAASPDFESFRAHLASHIEGRISRSCPECRAEFPSSQQLESHVASHFLATSVEYGCQACLKLFPRPDELQKHLLDLHAHHLYRCALCRDVFDSKVGVQVHFAVKHSNECQVFKCNACNAAYRSEPEFALHVQVTHLAKAAPYRCLLCEQTFASEPLLQRHLDTHGKQFPCTLCSQAFHVEFLLEKHMQACHTADLTIQTETDDVVQNLSVKPRPVESRKDSKCDICDQTFASDAALFNHRRQTHNVRGSSSSSTSQKSLNSLSLLCAYCNEPCKSRSDLENHMKSHTASPTKHKCNICDEVCPSATTLAEHKLTHCKVTNGSTCAGCREVLRTEEQFVSHVTSHGGGPGLPLPCVICRQTLMSEVELRIHARFHVVQNDATTQSTACCVCEQQMPPSNLIITGRQENGMQSFMCKDCFHAKGTPSRCPECRVKFESPVDLEHHRKLVHATGTFQCIKCQKSFSSEDEIEAHVATHVLQEGSVHECRLCRSVFESPAKLQCHLIEHTFQGCRTGFSCYLCSVIFTAPHLLQGHMLSHGLQARPYDCPMCHQRFFFRAELEHHALLHQDAMEDVSLVRKRGSDVDEDLTPPESDHMDVEDTPDEQGYVKREDHREECPREESPPVSDASAGASSAYDHHEGSSDECSSPVSDVGESSVLGQAATRTEVAA
ncbi:zinc finger protein 423-like isoform X2 [Ornithodoros turicata]|uniref:zinc finger protein 423-like isoform X2 n=1 Tax=Ornithodoros turicata TaxID=34597 RepID=UPI0031388E1F